MAARRLGGDCERAAKGGCGADHRVEIATRLDLLGEGSELVLGAAAAGRPGDGLHHLFGTDRLDQVIGRTGTHRLDRELRRGAGGQHQDRERRAAALHFGDEVAGLFARDRLVEHDRGQLHAFLRPQRGDRRLAFVDADRAPAVAGGVVRHRARLRWITIYDQQEPCFVLFHIGIHPSFRPYLARIDSE